MSRPPWNNIWWPPNLARAGGNGVKLHAEPIDVVFDAFNKKDFEKKIILSILPMTNIETIAPGDSVREPGLGSNVHTYDAR